MNNLIALILKIIVILLIIIAVIIGSYYLGMSGKVNLNISPRPEGVSTINPEPEILYVPEVTATPTPTSNE